MGLERMCVSALPELAEKKPPSAKHQGRSLPVGVCCVFKALQLPRNSTNIYTTIFDHLHMVALADRGEVKELVRVKPSKSTHIPQKNPCI